MNGLNGIGTGAVTPNAPTDAAGADFEAMFNEQLISTTAVLFQFIGSDIIESVLKDETSVD